VTVDRLVPHDHRPAALPRELPHDPRIRLPLELLVARDIRFASPRTAEAAPAAPAPDLVPGIAPRSEWAEFYDQLANRLRPPDRRRGPNFGNEVLLDALADSADLATSSARVTGTSGRRPTTCAASRS